MKLEKCPVERKIYDCHINIKTLNDFTQKFYKTLEYEIMIITE